MVMPKFLDNYISNFWEQPCKEGTVLKSDPFDPFILINTF